ncbi:hypothetical protein [Acinetobacter baumannii]|uniref:hypothetical protein n=1 Tax=Acinetobacter baumannii TaxID=470 RepID=UPI00066C4B05|nr:hypothetical protein [Acinetobacter baumannii]KMV07499.1 hypothetical protein AB895_0048 [Acinetobacter baumannii]MBF9227038.1 hypothetical protein [Acinetobacter baumannii]MCT6584213.1 hypothetical protein [Acinetobacter baumannii]MCT6587906.1 hypothetical protein [Acinetobacter baumannii]MCT6596082.1 hypothetical protein [Acinetobacter baumannii]
MIKLIYKPIDYLNIKLSDQSKQKYNLDIFFPFCIAFAFSCILLFINYVDNSINIFYKDISLLGSITSFFQSMPGFYIAALAAIATFPSDSMNKTMAAPTPYLIRDKDEKDEDKNRDFLSRRRFLCYMFAYLSFISIFFFFLSVTLSFIYSFKLFQISDLFLYLGYFISCLVVFYIVFQTIFITFLGLWYLGHRIHLNDNSK